MRGETSVRTRLAADRSRGGARRQSPAHGGTATGLRRGADGGWNVNFNVACAHNEAGLVVGAGGSGAPGARGGPPASAGLPVAPAVSLGPAEPPARPGRDSVRGLPRRGPYY